MPSLTDTDKKSIAYELERLFTLQDRPINKEKITVFLDEIELSPIPFPAVLASIRELAILDDLRQIKISTILGVARKYIENSTPSYCDHCDKTGIILMVDENGYEFSLACTCGNGQKYRYGDDRILQWNGEHIQITAKGKRFELKNTAKGGIEFGIV